MKDIGIPEHALRRALSWGRGLADTSPKEWLKALGLSCPAEEVYKILCLGECKPTGRQVWTCLHYCIEAASDIETLSPVGLRKFHLRKIRSFNFLSSVTQNRQK